MASQRYKVQLAPPTEKICDIQDGRANSEIGYYHLYLKRKQGKPLALSLCEPNSSDITKVNIKMRNVN